MNLSNIQQDIRHSATLPADFYRSATIFQQSGEDLFAKSWQYVADTDVINTSPSVYPFTLLPGLLDEPLMLTHNTDGRRYCLSNVCTHRAKIIVEQPGTPRLLSCGYHGRCFRLDGTFKSMPSFENVANFPSPADNLTQIPLKEWLGLLFVSLHPVTSLEQMIRPIEQRMDWLPLDTLRYVPETSKDYRINAHWALYCDNYLEGFHIPYVHPALNQALDFKKYRTEIFDYCNVQIGIADESQPCFTLPEGHPDYGQNIYAYYWWLFPNLMLNFYPWGLSLNLVLPLSQETTLVKFRSYYFEGTPYNSEANQLDQTEMEDESVVESVQRGIKSRFYQSGRFSPAMEKGVHHFHSLVARLMRPQ